MPPLADRFVMLEETLQLVRDGLDRGARHRGGVRGRARPGDAGAQQPPGASAGRIRPSSSAAAGSSRRCASWRATRTPATCSAARSRSPTSTTCCAATATTEGRDYDAIEKTNLTCVSITPDGAQGSLTPSRLVDRLGAWAEAGSQHTIFSVRNVWDLAKLELIGRDVLPQVRALGKPSPLGT